MPGNELTYDMLWQAYQKEKRSNELQLIPKSFYEEALGFIKELPGGGSEDGAIQKENAARLLNEMFERRKQKIMVYAAYGRQLPEQAPPKETTLYDEAVRMLKKSTLNGEASGTGVAALKVSQPIPEILLPSGLKIGPLEKDQVLEVKGKEDRAFLINNNICREM